MTQPQLVQNELTFAVGPKFQRTWGLREAAVFALEGIGVTVFVISALLDSSIGMSGGLASLVAAVVLLMSHLGKPMVAWRTVLNVRRSWISRGTLIIGMFVLIGGFFVIGQTTPWFSFSAMLERMLLVPLIITGGLILFYPGFAMQASAGIAFWSITQPVLSCLCGLVSGLLIVIAAGAPPQGIELITAMCLSALILVVIFTATHVVRMHKRGGSAAVSANALITKEWFLFWLLAIGAGLMVPFFVLVSDLSTISSVAFAIVVAGRIVGDVALRYAFLKVGTFESPMQNGGMR